jgi:lipid II:glycine glycyltransferase (peptidoglycan interpeptide bridge formation enzyme)
MEILEVNATTYAEAIPNPSHVFNSAAFNALNASKCDEVFYLLFKDSKIRLGIIFGVRKNILTSPFSAPFGGFEAASSDIRLQQIEAALATLNQWAVAKKMEAIRIVFPSFFYNSNLLNKVDNCLSRFDYERTNVDLNYQFQTSKLDNNYEKAIWYNAQKNLKRSQKANLTFEKLDSTDGEQAYNIIAANRSARNFPLRMSWEQVNATAQVIDVDYFLVKKENTSIGSALVFHVAQDIVQVVYWGDLPEYSDVKTMNFLSFHIFQYYKNQGIKIVDIGPSTENSIPNYGLCEFKESIGCGILIKTEFYHKLESNAHHSDHLQERATKMLRNIDAEEYHYFFPHDSNPFISEKFISLNAHKVDRIVRLVPETEKVQMGLIAGIKDGVLHAPFSAPFGGFHCKGENIYISVIESFVQDLILYAKTENITEIDITLPPDIYCPRSNAKIVNALIRCGFQMKFADITNCVNLKDFDNVYTHNASRTYYNQAVSKKLTFKQATTAEDQKEIYNIIVENRARMERPIYMTLEDILKTSTIFPTDFFKVIDAAGEITAGAILYRSHEEIVYALFWGDEEKGRSDRSMDFLILNLWNHYKAAGYLYIDLGISTVAGSPNEGLLRFKETHECISSLRYSFTWTLEEKR